MSLSPEHEIPHLEFDESVPPRPEEEVADATRRPDPGGPEDDG
ncbi:hypothetical protein [Actinotalea sp. K2]|nr:hypothetical protein [Actinotalea sp. K2]